GFPLDRDEVGKRQDLFDVRERVPIPDASGQRITPQWVRSALNRVAHARPHAMAKPGTSLLCAGAPKPLEESARRDHRRTATDHARPSVPTAQPRGTAGPPDTSAPRVRPSRLVGG